MSQQSLTFEEWKKQLDSVVVSRLGLSCDDLPDWDFYAAFEAGSTPRRAAQEFITRQLEDAGFDPDSF